MSEAIRLIALALGVALIAAGVAWRMIRSARVRQGIRRGLADPDPAVRIAAVRQAAEIGLASTAPALLRAVRTETDPAVRAAVVDCVAAHQWEPASTAAIVELRLWAKAYVASRPDLARPTGLLHPGVPGTVPSPSLHPAREHEFRRRTATDVHLDERSPLGPPADDDPLTPVRVVVTGVGGAAGVAVLRALRAAGHVVIGVDADPDAVGIRLADHGHPVPRCDDPTYLVSLIHVATLFDAEAIIGTVTEEFPALIAGAEFLRDAGLRFVFPDLATVQTCRDKWAFFQAMRQAGVPVPATSLGGADGVPGPWIVKPRFGRGSRQVHAVAALAELDAALALVDEPLVQTAVCGREFTADALVWPSGTLAGVVPRWRIATKGGISTVGETFEDDRVVETVGLALKAVGHIGPANVQGFVDDDGSVTVIEVNPRFSGGLPLSLAAGADFVGEFLRAVMGRQVRPERLVGRPGVRMHRYFDEVYQA
ncbi:MAG: ATP-grasp domain-containing protein [Acidothermus sp.]|nr:ATP-grasp domain-containing protein [Acidothermus sp.]